MDVRKGSVPPAFTGAIALGRALQTLADGWSAKELVMNLDDLTIGQARQLAAMFGNGGEAHKKGGHIFDAFVGCYCVCRASSAGVHAGTVKGVQQNGDGTKSVVLGNARRLWSWKAKDGVALSGVAKCGIDRAKSKLDVVVEDHAIDGVCEIIACTDVAKESIHGA